MEGTANARGGDDPYVSPEGHNIIDVVFEGTFKLFGEEEAYEKILDEIVSVPGLVTHGLLLKSANAAIVAKKSGIPELIELQRSVTIEEDA